MNRVGEKRSLHGLLNDDLWGKPIRLQFATREGEPKLQNHDAEVASSELKTQHVSQS
jgi:hypothetical protein